jgi:hypothetical protein
MSIHLHLGKGPYTLLVLLLCDAVTGREGQLGGAATGELIPASGYLQ